MEREDRSSGRESGLDVKTCSTRDEDFFNCSGMLWGLKLDGDDDDRSNSDQG